MSPRSPRYRLRDQVERRALTLAGLATAVVLGVVFYFPVGLVLHESVVVEGRLSLSGFREVLTDPFYFGGLAGIFADPLAVDRHLRGLLRALRTGDVRMGLFGFTAYQAALSTVASVLLGLPGAYALSRFEFRGRRTLRSLTLLPFVLPGIMVAIGFFAMFSREGPFNDLLAGLGLGQVDLVGSLSIVILAHAFYNAPLVTRVTAAAWESVDVRTVETARSLGASRRRAFFDVVVPQLVPAVLTGALLTFLFTFMTFPIVLALGGLQLATVEVWVYDRVRSLALHEAAVLAVLETLISVSVTYAYLRYEARSTGGSGTANPPEREPLVPDLRALVSPRRIALVGYGVVLVLVFVGPIASMVVESLTAGDRFTLDHYAFLLERQVGGAAFQTRPWPAVRNSLLFGVSTLVLALPMGVAVAALTTDRTPGPKRRTQSVTEALALLPLAVSGIVVGVGLLQGLVFGIPLPFVGRVEVTGPVAVAAAHAVAAYPFVVRSVAPLLAEVDRAAVESARALGASRTRTLLDVELPLVASGVLAGAAFAFAISIGEFSSTVILATGSESYTMPVAVERYLGRRTGPAMAMGTVLLLVTAVSFVVIERAGERVSGP